MVIDDEPIIRLLDLSTVVTLHSIRSIRQIEKFSKIFDLMGKLIKMSFIAVYLTRAERFLVICENWVQDLLNAKLKNNGRNSNQNFLIFWSATDGVANLNVQTNFNAPLSSHYEDTIHEICYLGRIIKFFGETRNNK